MHTDHAECGRGIFSTWALFYLTTILCHNPQVFRRARGQWDKWITLIRQTADMHGNR
jgi:hypothetical protein